MVTEPLVVWLPPGTTALTSGDVEVRPMIPEPEEPVTPEQPGTPLARAPRPPLRLVRRQEAGAAGGSGERLSQQVRDRPGQWLEQPVQREPAVDGIPSEAGDSLSVPPEIEAEASAVMQRYDMTMSGMRLITTKPDKGGAIWRIETEHGPRSLKLLHREPGRSLFSIGAQEYLVGRGARVPALVRNRQGQHHVIIDGRTWLVTDWIDSLTPATKVGLEGAQALCYGLGEFHRLSQGYVPPEEAAVASRLYRWPQVYRRVQTKTGWFRVLAEAYSDLPAAPLVHELSDRFERQAAQAAQRLERSPYRALTARGEQAWGIAHQDECARGKRGA